MGKNNSNWQSTSKRRKLGSPTAMHGPELWHLLLCLSGWQRSTGPCKVQEADHVHGLEELQLCEVWQGFPTPERDLSRRVPVRHDGASTLGRMCSTKAHKQSPMVIPGRCQSGAGPTTLQQPATLSRGTRGQRQQGSRVCYCYNRGDFCSNSCRFQHCCSRCGAKHLKIHCCRAGGNSYTS